MSPCATRPAGIVYTASFWPGPTCRSVMYVSLVMGETKSPHSDALKSGDRWDVFCGKAEESFLSVQHTDWPEQ